MPRSSSPQVSLRSHAKNLSDHERALIVTALVTQATDGVLRHGALTEVAQAAGIDVQTVRRIWRRADTNYRHTGVYSAPSMMHHTGHRRTDLSRELERLRAVGPQSRSTIRAAAQACYLPPTTLFRELRNGRLRVETSVAKPMLSDDNKKKRVEFSVEHVNAATHLFDSIEDVVHVDEKLFYLGKVKRRCVLLPDEPKLVLRLKSKRHIPKVMVLAAVARPRADPITGKNFDGKIGTWALLKHEPAKRNSRNRPAGTKVPYAVPVNKDTYREMLVKHVLPTIREKFPGAAAGRRIHEQQDNASPHIQPDDAQWGQAVAASGCDVQLQVQPPNSPDMNVLDLAVFNALQARQQSMVAHTLDGLVKGVEVALAELPPATLDAGYLTLQCVMDDCVAVGDDNTFKVRHMSKAKLRREGRLPRSIKCCATTASFLPPYRAICTFRP